MLAVITPNTRGQRVSIRARHLRRAMLSGYLFGRMADMVSIRARHLRRAMHPMADYSAHELEFQSAPGIYAGRCVTPAAQLTMGLLFQSAPGIYAGRCGLRHCRRHALQHVSIRARHLRRAMPITRSVYPRPTPFQSAPGIYAGRCLNRLQSLTGTEIVSIRARHLRRAMPAPDITATVTQPVSIRARHLRRAMPVSRILFDQLGEFQSAPGIYAGRCQFRDTLILLTNCFNPRPAFTPGDARPGTTPRRARAMFQSAPGIYAGRCLISVGMPRPTARFNPRPAFTPGDARQQRANGKTVDRFNPRPAFTPGDALLRSGVNCFGDVSIRARHLRRAMHRPFSTMFGQRRFQSAPGIYAGRCRRSATARHKQGRFNPRPAFTPGDAPIRFTSTTSIESFNPRPAFTPGDADSKVSD